VLPVQGETIEIMDDERQRWPDVQDVPHACFGYIKESQIEATW
jgi:hypothetical protein